MTPPLYSQPPLTILFILTNQPTMSEPKPFNPPLGPQPYTPALYLPTPTNLLITKTPTKNFLARTNNTTTPLLLTKRNPLTSRLKFFTPNTKKPLFALDPSPKKSQTTHTKYPFIITVDDSPSGRHSTVSFANASAESRSVQLLCRSNWDLSLTEVLLGERFVAKIVPSEKVNSREVMVEPMVDLSMIMAVVVVVAEWKVKKGGGILAGLEEEMLGRGGKESSRKGRKERELVVRSAKRSGNAGGIGTGMQLNALAHGDGRGDGGGHGDGGVSG
ncbi:hypothetical protein K470DRAFT_286180 [Piedraia hortae CBS 480.64]|uniref:Uncharacterized protein n=1 Tax=Piedraia hortae CBS 480.64 TaxID=1314780 RepID=A0A6A7CBA2_9PEZI|nr:hypothetical protein K470DRAFT_286180 [Piedraia hortae CBS 480.64]